MGETTTITVRVDPKLKGNLTGDYPHLQKCHSEGAKRPKNLFSKHEVPSGKGLFAPFSRSE